MIYYVVHFHADGGVVCIPGRRVFTDPERANAFANYMRDEPGHLCGSESVSIEETDHDPGNTGRLYPEMWELNYAERER